MLDLSTPKAVKGQRILVEFLVLFLLGQDSLMFAMQAESVPIG